MPHIEQPLQLIILSIKINKYKKFFFSFVFKVMEYPQTRTQKFNLNQEKKIFSGMTPLDENFYHSFAALTLKGR